MIEAETLNNSLRPRHCSYITFPLAHVRHERQCQRTTPPNPHAAKDPPNTAPKPAPAPSHHESIAPDRHHQQRPRPPNQRPHEIHDAPPTIRLLLKQDMNLLAALGGIQDDAADLRAGDATDVRVADLVGVAPGGILGGAGGDELDDGVVRGLDVDVFGGGVVYGCDGGVGVGGGVG